MIRLVKIEHFGKHKVLDVTLDLVTTFTGDNNSGKSTALRAIRWVLTNRPKGTTFKGNFGRSKFARVRLDVDKHRVTRSRGRLNVYKLDGKVLKSFKTSPPKPVEIIANVGDANFQGQIDAPFWFTMRPGDVAKQLNKIINLSVIDQIVAAASKQVSKAKSEVKVSKERLKKVKAVVQDTQWADKIAKRLTRLDKRRESLGALRSQCDTLSAAINGVLALGAKLNELDCILEISQRLIAANHKWRGVRKRRRELERTLERIEQLAKKRGKIPSVRKLMLLDQKYQTHRDKVRELSRTIFALDNLGYELCQLDAKMEKTEAKLRKTKRCPVCGRSLSQSRSATSTRTSNAHRHEQKVTSNGEESTEDIFRSLGEFLIPSKSRSSTRGTSSTTGTRKRS